MVMNNIVKFAVTRNQFEKIKQLAELNQMTVSCFIRHRILTENFEMEKLIIEMHRRIMENGRRSESSRMDKKTEQYY